jgi:hypothetical protein
MEKYNDDEIAVLLKEQPQLPYEGCCNEFLMPVFKSLPKEVVDFLHEKVSFMFVDNSFCLTERESKPIQGKKLVVLYMGGDWEEEYKDNIAHEIAHAYLDHASVHSGSSEKEQQKIETEADNLIEKWGFNRRHT